MGRVGKSPVHNLQLS